MHSFIPIVHHLSATVKVEQAKHTPHILSPATHKFVNYVVKMDLWICECKYDFECRWGLCASDTSDGNWIGHKMLFAFIVDDIIYFLCLSFSSVTFRLFFSHLCFNTSKPVFIFLTLSHRYIAAPQSVYHLKPTTANMHQIGKGERMSTIGSSKTWCVWMQEKEKYKKKNPLGSHEHCKHIAHDEIEMKSWIYNFHDMRRSVRT